MRASIGARFVRVAVAAAMLATASIGSSAAFVSAASITFGTPTASSTFGQGIDFSQPYSGGDAFREVDIVITYPGGFGPAVDKVENVGASSFKYELDTSAGQIQPNTQLVARFQVTFADGTIQNGPDIHVTYLDDRFRWQTKVGKVVRLHWYEGDDAFAQQALRMGEQGIAAAATFMGFDETAPIDFYVYADQAPFYDALGPGTRDNVGGEANTETRTLFALIAPDELGYAASVVPHELTHVVFDDVTGNPYHYPPHWLNEGIAVYVSQGFESSDKRLVAQAVSGGNLMPLAAIRGQFPTTQERFYLAYAESVSAVDYFMRTYGHDDLVKLVKAFGTGVSDDEAFKAAIGIDTDAFDKAWMKANGVTALQSFGPQPAPTGPIPPGWTGAGLAGSSAASTQEPSATATPVQTASPSGEGAGQSQGGVPVIVFLAGAALGVVALVLLVVAASRRASS
ncbi:MAG: peptidase MA family metallohydrolase [Candidatus Limnocylindrales bacterium]